MPKLLHRALWIAALALVACQAPPDISGELAEYANLVSDVNFYACRCPHELGFETRAECTDAVGTVGTGDRECMASVLEGHEEAAKDFLDCANVAYRPYARCLELNDSCEDGRYSECTKDHDIAVGACPRLPHDIRVAFTACTE